MSVDNPFTPGFGELPAVLAGRNSLLDDFERALDSNRTRDRVILISGGRGTGKTVLLSVLKRLAEQHEWQTTTLHTASGSLPEELRSATVDRLRDLDPDANSSTITGGGIGQVGSLEREAIDRYGESQEGLGRLLERLATLTEGVGGGMMLAVDEVQAVDREQLQEVTQHLQDLVSAGHRVSFVAAGIRAGVDALLQHEKTTFLRRALPVQLGNVGIGDAADAIRMTIADTDKTIAPEAAVRAAEISEGYPYLIQLVGANAWDTAADADVIEVEDVEHARPAVIRDMVRNVHAPALRPLGRRKMQYLYAMLVDDGPAGVGDVAQRMDISSDSQSQYRSRLIDDGLVRAAGYGKVEFAVPFMREALLDRQRGGEAPSTDSGVRRLRTQRGGNPDSARRTQRSDGGQ